jgi:hypothetical protein
VKRFILILACLVVAAGSLSAQAVNTTVCDVLAHPKSFDGKIVQIKGTVQADFDQFAIVDTSCRQSVNAIWLEYPTGTKAKSGPVEVVELQLAKNSPGTPQAVSTTPVTLNYKSKEFKDFDAALSEQFKAPGRCLACTRSTVTATLTGRIDAVDKPGLEKNASGMFTAINGYGNLNRYSARLVLQSVADVQKHDIDYSKAAALPKDNADPEVQGDPLTVTHQVAKAFGAGNQFGDAIESAAAAFGKPGEHNGVVLSFKDGNVTPRDEGEKSKESSPDGLVFNTIINMNRLPGRALQQAIAHAGAEISDYRSGKYTDNMFTLEAHAWQVTFFASVATQDKSLTAPGGYILWNQAWPESERATNVSIGLQKFLTEWEGLER